MLEAGKLLVEAWAPASAQSSVGPAQQRRNIRSSAQGEVFGFAVWTAGGRSWWTCLAGPTIQVRETEDASLLMSVRRSFRWSRRWAVYDADDRLVGRISPRRLVNNRGRLLATMERNADQSQARFLGPDKQELASFQARSDGSVMLIFGDVPDNNPFSRMLMLGAVLLVGQDLGR